MGPGLGLHKETRMAVKELIKIVEKSKIPLLLDADALKACAEFKFHVDFPCVLTPHSGEFQILTGKEVLKDVGEKIEQVSETAKELNTTILLKGPVDIVSNGIKTKINKIVHNPGMTVGGTGDVLSGIVGALLSQGFDPFRAAVAGVFINGAAGDFAAQERGYHLWPTDLIEWIPTVMEDPMSHIDVRQV
jgi:NAD(P)H-hydrate epimerase